MPVKIDKPKTKDFFEQIYDNAMKENVFNITDNGTEEQKQAMLREEERKRLIREQLD